MYSVFGTLGRIKHRVFILGKTLDNFMVWKKSQACMREVEGIPYSWLLAYLEQTEYDDGGRMGDIVQIGSEAGSATVENG